ncbi:MAG: fibronectin type III domain-containing protein [Patescibacteria group bacterium]
MFGVTGETSVISNLILEDVDITGDTCTSALACINSGTVTNCSSSGVAADLVYQHMEDGVGGLIGTNHGTITNSSSSVTVSGGCITGGLVSTNFGQISNSYATGQVTADFCGGGLVCSDSGQIINTYASGDVTGDTYVGGLVGYLDGAILESSFSVGSVNGSESVGGLIGYVTSSTFNNNGWWTGSFTDVIGDGDSIPSTESFYNETDKAAFYSSDHGIYTQGEDQWNFEEVWQTTDTYPILAWQPEPQENPTPTPTPESTPAPSPHLETTFSPATSSSSPPGTPACTSSKPLFIPDLFEIRTTQTSAKLFFTPQADTSDFYVSFPEKSNVEEHGEAVTLLREGVQSHTIFHLKPGTTYYAKVRGQNGCMPGDWSNVMAFKTNSQTFYKGFSPVSNTVPNYVIKISPKSAVPSQAPQTTPAPTQSPKPTEPPKQTQTDSQSGQASKKCFLWWCW